MAEVKIDTMYEDLHGCTVCTSCIICGGMIPVYDINNAGEERICENCRKTLYELIKERQNRKRKDTERSK